MPLASLNMNSLSNNFTKWLMPPGSCSTMTVRTVASSSHASSELKARAPSSRNDQYMASVLRGSRPTWLWPTSSQYNAILQGLTASQGVVRIFSSSKLFQEGHSDTRVCNIPCGLCTAMGVGLLESRKPCNQNGCTKGPKGVFRPDSAFRARKNVVRLCASGMPCSFTSSSMRSNARTEV